MEPNEGINFVFFEKDFMLGLIKLEPLGLIQTVFFLKKSKLFILVMTDCAVFYLS